MTSPTRQRPSDLFKQKPNDLFELRMDEREICQRLVKTLTPAKDKKTGKVPALVWVDRDAEALVLTGKLRLALQPGLIIIQIGLTTDQTESGPLIVAFGVGNNAKTAQLFATVEQVQRGHPTLVARWGGVTQEIIWNALVKTGQKRWKKLHPKNRFELSGLYVDRKGLSFLFSKPVNVFEIVKYFSLPQADRPTFDPKPIDASKPRRSPPKKPDKPGRPPTKGGSETPKKTPEV